MHPPLERPPSAVDELRAQAELTFVPRPASIVRDLEAAEASSSAAAEMDTSAPSDTKGPTAHGPPTQAHGPTPDIETSITGNAAHNRKCCQCNPITRTTSASRKRSSSNTGKGKSRGHNNDDQNNWIDGGGPTSYWKRSNTGVT